MTHAVVLVIAMGMAAYTTFNRSIPPALASVNPESLVIGEGGQVGGVAKVGRLSTIVKPVVVPTAAAQSHAPQVYVVGDGEDLKGISAKFGVSVESIRWSNFALLKRTDKDVSKGDKILIPPVNGVVVTVAPGDTLQTLASYYKVDASLIENFNFLRDPRLLDGMVLVIPDAKGPEFEKPAPPPVYLPQAVQSIGIALGGPSPGSYANRFYYGYCTWYVASRVANIPWLGDAGAWWSQAKAYGWPTGSEPQVGAIRVSGESYVGHVGYVEKVNADHTYTLSEMNFVAWSIVSQRTLGPGHDPALYGFIYPPTH